MAEAMFSTGGVELLAALVKVFKPALLNVYRNYVRQDERPCRLRIGAFDASHNR